MRPKSYYCGRAWINKSAAVTPIASTCRAVTHALPLNQRGVPGTPTPWHVIPLLLPTVSPATHSVHTPSMRGSTPAAHHGIVPPPLGQRVGRTVSCTASYFIALCAQPSWPHPAAGLASSMCNCYGQPMSDQTFGSLDGVCQQAAACEATAWVHIVTKGPVLS